MSNIILITVDALTAKVLKPHGGDVPWFQGTYWTKCFSNCGWTLPSTVSFMTGKDVHEHGVYNHDCRINDPLVQEHFKSNGFRTAGITNNTNLDRKFGWAKGFDTYVQYHRGELDEPFIEAKNFVRSQNRSGKFFLWLHTNIVHDYFSPFFKVGPNKEITMDVGGFENTPPGRRKFIIPQYKNSVHYARNQIMDFLKHVNMQNTQVVINTDHGEGLYPPRVHHGGRLHNDLIHSSVCILGKPGTYNTPISLKNIFYRLLQIGGIQAETNIVAPEIYSEDRAYLYMNDDSTKKTRRVQYTTHDESIIRSVIKWPHKYIYAKAPNNYEQLSLYNIKNDFDERNKLPINNKDIPPSIKELMAK